MRTGSKGLLRILMAALSWGAVQAGWKRAAVSAGLAALFLGASLSPLYAQSQSFVACHGQLKVVGNRIVDAHGQVITLRGMSMYPWASQGLQYYNATAVSRLVNEWKCTVLRIPILPGSVSSQEGLVKTVVDACIANGIYAIIDWHSMGGANATNASNFMKQMASLYGNTPNVMYETWNEPVTETWPTIKAYHEQVIAAIRSIDPNKIIFCSDPQWDQNPQQAAADPITTSANIAYVVHFYAASHGQWLIDRVQQALNEGAAIFATEYGTCEASGSGTFDPTETQVWWNFLDANGVGYTNWSVAALSETSAAFNPGTSATAWTDADLKPSGVLVKNQIVKMNTPLFGTCGASSPVPTGTFTRTPTPVVASTWRVNAGGPAYTDTNGNLWSADTQFMSGTAAAQGTTIAGTANPTLYDTQRYGGNFSYVFNVPAGTYQLTLDFAETYPGDFAAGDRVFNVLVNGVTVLSNLDVFAQAGSNTALNEVINNIAPSGGAITIQFAGTASKDSNAMVEALQVIPQPVTPTATRTNTPVPPSATPSRTHTPTFTSTGTATFTVTATRTHTPVPPTATNTNSPVPPTNTPIPPTATFTSSESLTATPVPPTMTNTPAPPTVTNTPMPPTATDSTTPISSATITVSATASSTPTGTFTSSWTPSASPTNTNSPVPPTVTNTPMPPTATRTATAVPPTATFTPTTVVMSGSFKVQLLSGVTSGTTNSPHPQIQVVNTGSGPLSLNNVTIRYWFNCDCTTQMLQAWVDWAGLMPSGTGVTGNVHVSVPATTLGGQTNYVLYTFTGNMTLQPGQMIQVQSRFNKSDWSNMTQSNDWSFAANTSFLDDAQVTGYLSGSLVWGQEPVAKTAALTVSNAFAFPNPSTGTGTTLSFNVGGTSTGSSASVLDAGNPLLLDPNAKITLSIYTLSMRLIWSQTLTGGAYGTTGQHEFYWNEKDLKGAGLANGIYILRVTIVSNGKISSAIAKILILR